MKLYKSILLLVIVTAGIKDVYAEEARASFERLMDVDYSFFMTSAKLPWGVDPFQKEPGFAKVPKIEDKFELTGIFYSKDQPMAVVNGRSVGTGDIVGDRKVEEIGENYVILKKHDSAIELNLPPVINSEFENDSDGDDEVEQ